jgi:hypothetical protein
VIDTLAELFAMRGVPQHIRSDNGPEFIASAGSYIMRKRHGLLLKCGRLAIGHSTATNRYNMSLLANFSC